MPIRKTINHIFFRQSANSLIMIYAHYKDRATTAALCGVYIIIAKSAQIVRLDLTSSCDPSETTAPPLPPTHYTTFEWLNTTTTTLVRYYYNIFNVNHEQETCTLFVCQVVYAIDVLPFSECTRSGWENGYNTYYTVHIYVTCILYYTHDVSMFYSRKNI